MPPIFQLSTIWAETADNARSAARTFVLGGLSDKHYGLSSFWVADRINVIDSFFLWFFLIQFHLLRLHANSLFFAQKIKDIMNVMRGCTIDTNIRLSGT